MEHLKKGEIFEYLKAMDCSFGKNSEDVKKLNSHILSCSECAAKLRRAIFVRNAVKSMAEDNFRVSDLAYVDLDVSADEVRRAAADLSEVVTEHERAFEY